jgi:hypothetical protein
LKSAILRLAFSVRNSERKVIRTVEVELVVGGLLEEVLGGLEEVDGGTELELDEDPPPLQGSVDSKSLAT